MARRVHSPEFKLEAVRLAKSGVPKAQIARDLEIGANLLRIWVGKHEADADDAFPERGQMKSVDAENARLRRELKRVTAERDIIKKALGYFAKDAS
jgi:transposase